jgi:4a-hydroxytetrahydrobiopterin dehydratase
MSVIIGRAHPALKNLKEAILVVCSIYFFSLAFAIQNGRPTYHAEHPFFFLCIFSLFLLAIISEIWLEWGKRREVIIWAMVCIASYGIIGLYIVPIVFGPQFLLYVLFEPVIIVFFGGFVFAYAKLFTHSIFFSTQVSTQEMKQALEVLPGWQQKNFLEKTFHFQDFVQALNFINRVSAKVQYQPSAPGFIIQYNKVTIRFRPHPLRGLSRTEWELAKQIEHLV